MGSEKLQVDLTTESGIARAIHNAELADWEHTFRFSPGKIDLRTLAEHARTVADWRIEELVEEHGSLTDALETDSVLKEQLTVFENGSTFLRGLKAD